jgi:hypothetical protein
MKALVKAEAGPGLRLEEQLPDTPAEPILNQEYADWISPANPAAQPSPRCAAAAG